MSSTTSSNKTPLRIGVLYEETQMCDLAGLDILGNCSERIIKLSADTGIVPGLETLVPLAVPMEFLYISSSPEKSWISPSMKVGATHTYENAPRDLDILLLGGPNPMAVSEASLPFLKEAALQTKYILTTCSGGIWLARSGVLDGKKATTNRLMYDLVKQTLPAVEWQDVRWTVDTGLFEGAEIWTAGGAQCGIEMVIEFALRILDERLVRVSCGSLDFAFEGRKQAYDGPYVSPIAKAA